MKKLLLLLLGFQGITGHAYAAGTPYGDETRRILRTPLSASMAGADLAVSADPSPGNNPAQCIYSPRGAVSFSYASFFDNSYSVFYSTYALNFDSIHGISAGLGYVMIPDIPVTDQVSLDDNGSIVGAPRRVSASYIRMRVAYGRGFHVTPDITVSAGAALNTVRKRLIRFTGYGIGIDAGAGLLYRPVRLTCGVILENASMQYLHWSSAYHETISPKLRAGVGWTREIPYLYGRIRLAYTSVNVLAGGGINAYANDEDHLTPRRYALVDDPLQSIRHGSLGIEYTIRERVALRAGTSAVNNLAHGAGTFGGGVYLRDGRMVFDLAYLRQEQLEGTYQLSISYFW